ncbi:hypothetical protein AgCh_038095 [Apium graveolens]
MNSLEAQVSAFGSENIIDLNDNYEETEDLREITGLWKWVEDKLLISAWLNVSIDPLVSTDQKDDVFWERIHQYYEDDNPGVIKRGVVAMKKEGNNDTPISDEFEPVRPKGTKAATKRKRKGKATTVEVDEWKSLQVNHERKMDIMDKLNKIRLKELEAKQSEMDLEVIMADTTKMNDAQRKAHAKLLEKIMSKN